MVEWSSGLGGSLQNFLREFDSHFDLKIWKNDNKVLNSKKFNNIPFEKKSNLKKRKTNLNLNLHVRSFLEIARSELTGTEPLEVGQTGRPGMETSTDPATATEDSSEKSPTSRFRVRATAAAMTTACAWVR